MNQIAPILSQWESTMTAVAIAAAACFILLMIGLRQFALWFFRVDKIMQRQTEILTKLEALQTDLAKYSRPAPTPIASTDAAQSHQFHLKPAVQQSSSSESPQFKIDN